MAPSKKFRNAVLAYKYSSPNLSLLERLVLNSFWEGCTNFYPKWLAPNLITLTGFACILTGTAISWSLSPDGRGTLPQEYYLVLGVLTFLYQTLDGSDGKQARRTKSGSALGELMDHGVDALTTSLCGMYVMDAIGFGYSSLWPWIVVVLGQMGFYLSNLTLLHLGKQVFYNVDVMELQTVMIWSCIFTGIFGVSYWQTKVPFNDYLPDEWKINFKTDAMGLLNSFPGDANNDAVDLTDGFELRQFVAFGGLFGCVTNIVSYLFRCLAPYLGSWESRPDHVKAGVQGTGFMALLHQVIVIFVFCSIQFVTWWRIRTSLAGHPLQSSAYRALLLCSTFSFGDTMDRILVLRVGRESYPLIPPGLMHISAICVAIWHFESIESVFPLEAFQVPFFWFPALTAMLGHLVYFISRGGAIASVLNIHPFKVKNWKQLKLD